MAAGRILIVDDEPFVRKTLGRMLSHYDLVMVGSGEEAVGLLKEAQPFHVILCDLMMPSFTGIDLYEHVRAHHPGQEESIVFLTGGVFTEEVQAFLNEIPNYVIEKPFDFQRLREVVQEMLGRAGL